VEFRIHKPDGEVRWCAGTAAATVDKNGRVVRVSGVTVDITERKRAEERQNLLTREVDHRAKNALALAQSIVRLTRCDDVKDYVAAVEGRISALARVHTVLSLSSWQGAEIGQLIEEELSPYSSSKQIEIQGPQLAVHELITNSVKYGALSVRTGLLDIRWEILDGNLELSWDERGGPPVIKPTTRGFGTRSVIASVGSQLGGRADFDWRAEGLLCRLWVPLDRLSIAQSQGRERHKQTLTAARVVQ
jgi:two-component sensor histidine kinase